MNGKHTLINLSKGTNGFGFNIVGGADRPYLPYDGGIFVSRIRSTGAAAADGRMKRGDRIVAVNGMDLQSINHEDAVELFRALKGDIALDIIQGGLSVFPPPMATVRSRTTSNVSSVSSRAGTPSTDRYQCSAPAMLVHSIGDSGNTTSGNNNNHFVPRQQPTNATGFGSYVGRKSPMKQLPLYQCPPSSGSSERQHAVAGEDDFFSSGSTAASSINQAHTPERAASYRPREGSLQSTPSRGFTPTLPPYNRLSGSSEVGDTVDTPSMLSMSSPAPSLASLVDDCASMKSMPSSVVGGGRVRTRAAAVGAYATTNMEGSFGLGAYSETVYTVVGLAAVLGIAVVAYRRWAN